MGVPGHRRGTAPFGTAQPATAGFTESRGPTRRGRDLRAKRAILVEQSVPRWRGRWRFARRLAGGLARHSSPAGLVRWQLAPDHLAVGNLRARRLHGAA